MNGEGPKDEEQEVIEAGDSKTQDEINGEAEGDPVKNSIGFALLMKMGWKEGDGLGLHKQGRRDPIIVDAEEREPYAGLAHASEVNPFSKSNANKKAIHELESWEIEEKRRDFFKGSDSSMWVSAGLLEDQKKDAKGIINHASSPTITTYKDAWDDKVVSEWKLRADEEAHEASWEDSWAHVMNRDLERMTINLEHFFACCHVLGPFVKMLHIETTGEIFQSKIWASSSKDLQNVLERKLRGRSRVLRPIHMEEDSVVSSVYAVVQSAHKEDEEMLNREATRVFGCNIYGNVYLVCRQGRHVVDMILYDYIRHGLT